MQKPTKTCYVITTNSVDFKAIFGFGTQAASKGFAIAKTPPSLAAYTHKGGKVMKTLQELEAEVQTWRDKQKKCLKDSQEHGYCQGWIHCLEAQIKDRCIYIGEVEGRIGWSRESYLAAHGCM